MGGGDSGIPPRRTRDSALVLFVQTSVVKRERSKQKKKKKNLIHSPLWRGREDVAKVLKATLQWIGYLAPTLTGELHARS